MPVTKSCPVSLHPFHVTDEDLAFYKKMGVPAPTLCPDERHRRRHGWINDYKFYRGKCDATGKYFISTFPPESEYRVLSQEAWYSESRDDKAEGRDFDFSRPFFEQFDELMHAAPQIGISSVNNQNSDYCESVANCRNCYLVSESSNCEDCFYSYWIQKCRDCSDLSYCHECQWCYECLHCYNGYQLFYSENCEQCSDSAFLRDCSNCQNCIGCTNLRQKEYHIFNKPYSKEDYEAFTKEIDLSSRSGVAQLANQCHAFWQTQPARHLQIQQAENCTGNYIRNAKNCHHVYHCYDAEHCAYGEHVWRGAKYCYDANTAGRNAELIYESTNSGLDSYNVKFCRYCLGCRDTEYSVQCPQSKDLFGCVSLKPQNQFCILNKQYPQQEYHDLKTKIIAHMTQHGEYGEFFPLSISLFGYNDSVSGDEMPLTKAEAFARGYKWQDPVESEKYAGPAYEVPDKLSDAPDDLCQKIIPCRTTQKPFRIIPQELAFYQKLGIPLPDQSFQSRFRTRLSRSWPMSPLHDRTCAQCQTPIHTTYSPESPEKVLCEECYLQAVH